MVVSFYRKKNGQFIIKRWSGNDEVISHYDTFESFEDHLINLIADCAKVE